MSTSSSDLDDEQLIDSLIPDIDELRDLGREFGTRAYRLFVVARLYTSGEVGLGDYVDTEEEILPPPFVRPWDALRLRLLACGIDEAGSVRVTEVSLSHDYNDLCGVPAAGVEHLFLLREAYGQHQPDRYFTLDQPPYPDRERDMGWVLTLRRVR